MKILVRVLGLFLIFLFFGCQEKLSNKELFEKYYVSPISKEEGRYSGKPDINIQDKFYYEAHESINSGTGYSVKLFERLSITDQDKYKEEADWFRLLALIKEDRMEEAEVAVKNILSHKYHKYEKQTKELKKYL